MARFLRGAVSARRVYDVFVREYSDSAVALFLEMAEVLPDEVARQELFAAAGFRTDTDPAGSLPGRESDAPSSRSAREHTGGQAKMVQGASFPESLYTPSESLSQQPSVGTDDAGPLAPQNTSDGVVSLLSPSRDGETEPPAREQLSCPPAASTAAAGSDGGGARIEAAELTARSPAPDGGAPQHDSAAAAALPVNVRNILEQDARPAKRPRARRRKEQEEHGAGAQATLPAADEDSMRGALEQHLRGGQQLAARRSAIFWIRQDVRLHDNPALCRAAAQATSAGGCVVCAYVHAPEEDGDDVWTGESWRPAGATLFWKHYALAAFDEELRRRYGDGAGVVFARGPSWAALASLCDEVGAATVVASRRYEPLMAAADEVTAARLQELGVQVQYVSSYLLHEPASVVVDMARWRGHFGTLMPFYEACNKLGGFKGLKPVAAPAALPAADRDAWAKAAARVGSLTLTDLKLYPPACEPAGRREDWGAQMRAAWDISEGGAARLLSDFLRSGLSRYETHRNRADRPALSRLSPYLHAGQISARYVMSQLALHSCEVVSKTFWRRLVWRDLAYWQLHHFPRMPVRPMRPQYGGHAWDDDEAALRAWQRGRTGFPLVDAGMRELWQTGYMPQSVRMVVAAFLTEYLNMNWVHGARWFHWTLVDADLAINCMMWQNAGKSGLDQWNFTVLPTSTATDPNGDYIRRWVPELAAVANKWIHKPWEASAEELQAAGVTLGVTYPHRITTTSFQVLRLRNIAALRAARAQRPEQRDSGGYDVIEVPRGSAKGLRGSTVRVFTKPELRDEGAAPGKGVRGVGKGVDKAAKARASAGSQARARARTKPQERIVVDG